MSRAEPFSDVEIAESRASPREFVESFQRDLLRLAYALTGDESISVMLSRDVLLDVLTGPEPDETDPTGWHRLLAALGRRYLRGTDPEGIPGEPSSEEQARLREALELLNRRMRTALVLRDLGGLSPPDVATISGYESDELKEVLEWSRERLTEVELQFLDPATGDVLTRSAPHVRYDPKQSVMLVFEQSGQKSLISVTADLPSGERRGTVRLKAEGLWDARIIVGDEGSGYTASSSGRLAWHSNAWGRGWQALRPAG
ncbi:MAG: hypothetical protein R2849_07740 [Thermomicrobiales bacterium]